MQSELAKKLDLGKLAPGSPIDRQEHAGMVERHGDTADRRAKRMVVTAAGRTARGQLRALASTTSDMVLAGLGKRSVELTVRTLQRMKANVIEALDADSDSTLRQSPNPTKCRSRD